MSEHERAGRWFRVSTGDQSEANQEPDVNRWCEQHEYVTSEETTYRVHGKSASKGKHQDDLDRALADMKAGKFTVLVVWAADRIERRGALAALQLAHQAREAGGRIEYVNDAHLNVTHDFSDSHLAQAADIAKFESKRKSERVRASLATIESNGAFHGRVPWGFTTEGPKLNRKLVPTEDGRKYVPEIYRQVCEGRSLEEVAKYLTELGVPVTWKGQPGQWWPRTLSGLIRNPVYMGLRCQEVRATDAVTGRKHREHGRTLHRCEALVDAAVWEFANKVLDGHRTPLAGKSDNPAMLSTALFCGNPDCPYEGTSPMSRVTGGRKGSQYTYYRCTGRGADRKSCGNLVRLAAVDGAVEEIVARTFCKKVRKLELVKGTDNAVALAAIRFAIKQLDLTADDYDTEHARLVAEHKRLLAQETVPDSLQEVESSQSYRQLWDELPVSERGPWLRARGFRVTATKTLVTMTQPGMSAGVRAEVAL